MEIIKLPAAQSRQTHIKWIHIQLKAVLSTVQLPQLQYSYLFCKWSILKSTKKVLLMFIIQVNRERQNVKKNAGNYIMQEIMASTNKQEFHPSHGFNFFF